MHGWWADRNTADRKFTAWIGEHGNVDEETGETLTTWPKEPFPATG
jgi:hypothetical protein